MRRCRSFLKPAVFKLPRLKKDICSEKTTISKEHQIQEILTACTENVNRFDYFLPQLKTNLTKKIKIFKQSCISSKIQEWGNITSDKKILKLVEVFTLDFEKELPSQKTKMIRVVSHQNQ